MSSSNTNGFFLSTLLHASVIGVFLFFTYAVNQQIKEQPKVFELVAGEGDNYMATEAPALGVPGGLKVNIPKLPTPESAAPVPVAPIQPAPEPVVEKTPITAAPPAPKTPKATAKAEPKAEPIRDFSKDVTRIAKKRAARLEAKYRAEREAAERKAKEEELKKRRMTKEEFDRQNRAEAAAKRSGANRNVKVVKIDADGIAKGVIGGSTANREGGAGGTALTRAEGDAIDGYTALLAQKIKAELDERPGVGAGMVVEVDLYILSDGTLTNIRIAKSSGSADFDDAVKDALSKIKMPPRPKGLSEHQRFPIRGVGED